MSETQTQSARHQHPDIYLDHLVETVRNQRSAGHPLGGLRMVFVGILEGEVEQMNQVMRLGLQIHHEEALSHYQMEEGQLG